MPKINLETIKQVGGTGYPPPYDAPLAGRLKQDIDAAGGLTQFGAKLVTLLPGAWSSQRHAHSAEDELVYVISGNPVLIEDAGETELAPGDFTAHPADSGNAHHMINRSSEPAVFLVIGTRAPDIDNVIYPDIDMRLDANGTPKRVFTRKDGTSF